MSDFSNPQSFATRSWHYTATAVVLHWVLALLIIFMIGLGWYMTTNEHEPGVRQLVDLYKSIGMIVLLLVFVRLLWRATHRPAALPQTVAAWQRLAAKLSQWLLYLCIVVMPLTGFLGSLFGRRPTAFFGWPLPKPDPEPGFGKLMFQIHGVTAWVLATLVVIHTLAALKHVWINRDQVFQRMWF